MNSAIASSRPADKARMGPGFKVPGVGVVAALAVVAVMVGAGLVLQAPAADTGVVQAPLAGDPLRGSILPVSMTTPVATRAPDAAPAQSLPSESDLLLQAYAPHGG